MSSKVRGLAEAQARLRTLAQRAPKKFERGLVAWGTVVLAHSRQECPVDEGNLVDTATMLVNQTQKGPSMQLMYGTEYAVPQHERLDYKHTVGKAKFLEDPLNEHAPELERMMVRFGKIGPEDL